MRIHYHMAIRQMRGAPWRQTTDIMFRVHVVSISPNHKQIGMFKFTLFNLQLYYRLN